MAIAARLKAGEALGNRVMKVDHAGEHGAVCIYTAQSWVARWRALELVDPNATHALRQIIHEEQEHHDISAARLLEGSVWTKVIDPIVATSTEVVIWLGMRL